MEDLRVRLARSLTDRYRVGAEIGRGGMATVLAAEDLKHGRTVAVKVLHPELAASLGPARFLREIEIAARLQHPHIVPLFDSGDADGLLYYLMPFIEGESLGARLEREGPMEWGETSRILGEVAGALDYAHRAGVVHRDVKPDNIMLADGHALVMDFGIATALSTLAQDGLTLSGTYVGTARYMSPEQIDGLVDVDGRTDVYSLGCVLYEALTGAPPYDASTPIAALAKQARGEYPAVGTVRGDAPLGVDDVIAKALRHDRNQRYATAGDFARALEGAVGATPAPQGRDVGRSIAVLPFKNMSADPEQEYFSDGMAEELINALTRLSGLKVVGRTSSFRFKDRAVDLREIGRELGVRTVLEGSVRKAGDRLRVTAQLVSVSDGFHLWSERYDRRMTDVFDLQDELTATIVERLEVTLTAEQESEPLVRRGTDDLEAYQLYLKGRHLWERRDLQQALACFEAAIARDPGYALAHAGLADGYVALAYYGYVPSPLARAKAMESATQAMAADPSLPESLISATMVSFFFDYDAERAIEYAKRAVALAPRSVFAHTALSYVTGVLGHAEEARRHSEKALELDSLSFHAMRMTGLGLLIAGEHEVGLRLCERALQLAPDSGVEAFGVGVALIFSGRPDEAIEHITRAIELMHSPPLYLLFLGWAHGLAGRRREAEAVIDLLRQHSQDAYCAWIQAMLGDFDAAFRSLELLLEQRVPVGVFLMHWAGFAGLRADRRYAEVVARVGLEHLLSTAG